MINSLISAISIRLNDEFGDEYAIYAEKVEQGLKEPCFFITAVSNTFTQKLGDRYFRKNYFCIQFFPKDTLSPVKECTMVAERLLLTLEYVNLNGELIKGTQAEYEINDGILSYFIHYDLYVYNNPEPQPIMEHLEKIEMEADL